MIPLYVFQLRLQTYVLLVDFVMNWLGLALTIAEILCAVWVIVVEKKKNRAWMQHDSYIFDIFAYV